MEENKELKNNDEIIPKTENARIDQSHEQEVEQKIAQIEDKITSLGDLEKEVEGGQGVKDTIAKMSPEEKQKIADRMKQVIEKHMEAAKTGAVLVAAMALAVTCEYYGIRDLNESSLENLGKSMPDWYLASGVGLMGLTALPGIAGFGIAATKGIQALKERVKLWNFNRKNKE